jgi:protein tyrosine phosphatase
MEPLHVSDFNIQAGKTTSPKLNMKLIATDYDILDQLFETEGADQQKVYDKIYFHRNRYSDIITYRKSRVVLKTGVNLEVDPSSDYINACYINSPFGGDRKIIAS